MTTTDSPAAAPPVITIADVRAAAERLRGVAHRTPVLTSRTIDRLVGEGARVFFKPEHLQRGGSFKIRGAYNRLVQLLDEERARGVVAFSSGNHAQGVALAARELGVAATILMPADAPHSKLTATRGYGAEVILYDRERESRDEIARHLAEDRGLTLVPPYDHPHIMAGQGTAALELIEDVGPLDLFLAPVGGGGLLSGSLTVLRALCPDARVIGAEPEAGDDWVQSLHAGERVRIPVPRTIADGIRTEQPGEYPFAQVQALGAEVLTVSDNEVKAAVRFLATRMKQIVEPTGAVPAALLLSGRLGDVRGKRIGVLLSGGNVDADMLTSILMEPEMAREWCSLFGS
jgi:threo-3-hydroxy-L-aspartate ammonia-lyase